MNYLVFVFIVGIAALLDILSYAIIGRVLLSLFLGGESKIYQFCVWVTEPIVLPIRTLVGVTPMGELPIDFSPLITLVLISIVQLLM